MMTRSLNRDPGRRAPARRTLARLSLPLALACSPVQAPPAQSAPVEAEPAAPAPSAAAAPAPSEERFLSALRDDDLGAAYALFDAAMQQQLPQERLEAIWHDQEAKLGELQSWEIVERLEQGTKAVRVARLHFERGELESVIAVDTESEKLSGVFLRPAPSPARTAPYVDTTKFADEPMQFGSEPFVLEGTLSLPVGAGPFPGIVLVQGSGPHDRDESIGANRPFKDLAEGLASRGVAVLRYDKRTKTHADKLADDVPTLDDEVVVDAVAATEALRDHPSVADGRIFVLGHSLGALLAPEIAERAKKVAGVVLLAPPGRKPWDMVIAQLRYVGAPAPSIAEAEQTAEALRRGDPDAPPFLGVPASYWRDWASRDGVERARRLKQPVLVLRGARDYQVTEEDLAHWQKGLAGVKGAEIETVQGVNHLFMTGAGQPGPAEYGIPGHVDVGVVERIARFVQGR